MHNFPDRDFDATEAEERLKAAKRRKLEAIERSAKDEEAKNRIQTAQDYTFFEKLTSQIIKNVQVKIIIIQIDQFRSDILGHFWS